MSKHSVSTSSRISIVMGIFVIVLVVGFSVPAAAAGSAATVKQWSVSFPLNDFVVAPDGTVFFSSPGNLVGRLNPSTNEITTWAARTFHIAVGPALSVEFEGQTYTDAFTVALLRLDGTVRLLLPSSGVAALWQMPDFAQDIAASSTHFWVSQFTDTSTTIVASVDPVTSVMTRYELPQSIAGPQGFIHGLSVGDDQLWFGVTAISETGDFVPFQQKTASLDPATSTARVWPVFASDGPVAVSIGRAATFAAGSSWTLYHSGDASLTGAYRLKPDANKVEFYSAPLGTPASAGDIPVLENVERATMAAGAPWAASTSEESGVQTAHVVRWRPLSARTVSVVSPEQPEVTVSTVTLDRVVIRLASSTTTINPDVTTISANNPSPNVAIWSFADRQLAARVALTSNGVVYFGLLTLSTSDFALMQLSA